MLRSPAREAHQSSWWGSSFQLDAADKAVHLSILPLHEAEESVGSGILLRCRAFVILAMEAVAFEARGPSQSLPDKHGCDLFMYSDTR